MTERIKEFFKDAPAHVYVAAAIMVLFLLLALGTLIVGMIYESDFRIGVFIMGGIVSVFWALFVLLDRAHDYFDDEDDY